jgi:hypothetical protein
MEPATTELKGWKVEIDGDCEWMIVHARDAAEAERIGWEQYTLTTGYTREMIVANNPDGDATAVIPLPQLDGGVLTLQRLIDLDLCANDPLEDATKSELNKPHTAIYLSTEW